MNLSLLLIAALLSASDAPAADRPDSRECEKVEQEIRKVQARMRRGYSAEQGTKLGEKLLELRKRRAKVCR